VATPYFFNTYNGKKINIDDVFADSSQWLKKFVKWLLCARQRLEAFLTCFSEHNQQNQNKICF